MKAEGPTRQMALAGALPPLSRMRMKLGSAKACPQQEVGRRWLGLDSGQQRGRGWAPGTSQLLRGVGGARYGALGICPRVRRHGPREKSPPFPVPGGFWAGKQGEAP